MAAWEWKWATQSVSLPLVYIQAAFSLLHISWLRRNTFHLRAQFQYSILLSTYYLVPRLTVLDNSYLFTCVCFFTALPIARYDDGRGPIYLMEQPVIFGALSPSACDATRAALVPAQQRPISYPAAVSQAFASGAPSSSLSLNQLASSAGGSAQRSSAPSLAVPFSPPEELCALQDVLIRWLCLFVHTPLAKNGDPNSNFTVYAPTGYTRKSN